MPVPALLKSCVPRSSIIGKSITIFDCSAEFLLDCGLLLESSKGAIVGVPPVES